MCKARYVHVFQVNVIFLRLLAETAETAEDANSHAVNYIPIIERGMKKKPIRCPCPIYVLANILKN